MKTPNFPRLTDEIRAKWGPHTIVMTVTESLVYHRQVMRDLKITEEQANDSLCELMSAGLVRIVDDPHGGRKGARR